MSENMNLMIPSDVVEKYLNCACLKYKGDTVVVIKGNTKANLKIDSDKVKVNGSDYDLKEKVMKKDGVIYIPSSLFENYLGFAYRSMASPATSPESRSSRSFRYSRISTPSAASS